MATYSELTYPKQKDKWVRFLKQELIKNRMLSKATLKDIGVVFDDYIIKTDYSNTKQTKLYINQGGEYCAILEILNHLDSEGRLKDVYELIRTKSKGKEYAVLYEDTQYNNLGLIIFSNEKDAISCFSRLFTLSNNKNNYLYDINLEYKKKYDKEVKDICKKSLKTIKDISIRDIDWKEVKFLYEGKRIEIYNPLRVSI